MEEITTHLYADRDDPVERGKSMHKRGVTNASFLSKQEGRVDHVSGVINKDTGTQNSYSIQQESRD